MCRRQSHAGDREEKTVDTTERANRKGSDGTYDFTV